MTQKGKADEGVKTTGILRRWDEQRRRVDVVNNYDIQSLKMLIQAGFPDVEDVNDNSTFGRKDERNNASRAPGKQPHSDNLYRKERDPHQGRKGLGLNRIIKAFDKGGKFCGAYEYNLERSIRRFEKLPKFVT